MPQSRLPDINTAFITYRRQVLSGLSTGKYSLTFGGLYALNALLPEKYRVTISSLEYEKMTRVDIFVKCTKCKKDVDYKTIQLYDLLTTPLDELITGTEKEKVWDCPDCGYTNKLSETDMTRTTLKEPYYLRVVPKPPMRKDGIMDRTKYHQMVEQWALTFLTELEERMAQFRDDNWQKGSDSEMVETMAGGEEEDLD